MLVVDIRLCFYFWCVSVILSFSSFEILPTCKLWPMLLLLSVKSLFDEGSILLVLNLDILFSQIYFGSITCALTSIETSVLELS